MTSIPARQPLAAVSKNVVITPAATAGKNPANKRKASDEPREEVDIDDDRCQEVDISCDRVRTKIRDFIASGEMKAGEFQKAIGANSKSYYSFMNQSGPFKGSGSCVYTNAFAFFKQRELNGIKAPKKPKVAKEVDELQHNVSFIELEGEAEGEVEVYDSCDGIRKKINRYLASTSITKAAFAREISKTYAGKKQVSAAVLSSFLAKNGVLTGNTSAAFYASYVFFEKIRIRDGKPKSEFRLDMEDEWIVPEPYSRWDKPGVDLKTLFDKVSYIIPVGRPGPYMNKYGKVRSSGW
ncbi:Uu.00g067910.m01.CDS01 [Anthostomella pinea]|uniref:Uu.00g067910.m01.CDS01 n=1 Tax=Anthostomella pinea TaxID=933095 RepID=A0AAI8YNJ2_9PEZI|nr:Uu.00g067910.m01.CDS01 [Anthostomella pinea]